MKFFVNKRSESLKHILVKGYTYLLLMWTFVGELKYQFPE